MMSESKRTGEAGINLIKKFEGLSLEKYQDAVGLWTIGYGHLIKTGENFDNGITGEKAEAMLRNDLADAEESVNEWVKIDITQNQFDALVSFVFNLGNKNFANSTLLKKLNNGEIQGAADQFLRWNKAGGKVLSGLDKRRRAERELFLSL